MLRTRYDRPALIEATGLSHTTIANVERGRRAHLKMHAHNAIMGVQIPPRPVAGSGLLPATGSARRIEALCTMGWSQGHIAEKLGTSVQVVNRFAAQKWITSRWAAQLAELFDELHMIPGPSRISARWAEIQGWAPPLAWEHFDDPDELPDFGADSKQSFPDRYLELRDHVGLNNQQIADAMGIELESLERQLFRYDMFKGRAA
ncbi:hypothetical protein [Mycobacterium sp. DL99]|uniref:hypothetical protein n=1 Tax=Mycobacterium sp. DL99 TaxID=2528957 RepID=UPI00107FFA52|nr:hypothetical protein [Mycobacterium sp. DL99]